MGHAKSICLNFGLARDYGGVCHLRFDDTNPEKEETEYVNAIIDAVKWLGFDWQSNFNGQAQDHLYYASNYFDFMYRAAEYLIEAGHAYVDEQTPEEMRANRGDFATPGKDSPFRSRTPAENLARFRAMRDGQLADGAAVLRAKIDMASPNINLRDPAIYRIRRATHHNTGDTWCIYPMYTFAHPIEDALEQITHSICTLEFEDQRPFYDWLLARLAEGGLLQAPAPHQYEFARLNLTYVITSKRKLKQLVDEGTWPAGTTRACPPSWVCVAVATRPVATRCLPNALASPSPTAGSTTARLDRLPCVTTWKPRPTAAWPCSTPSSSTLTNWDEVMGPAIWSPAQLPALPTRQRVRKPRRATSPSARKSGSSARTLKRCRPRATSACSRATRCA